MSRAIENALRIARRYAEGGNVNPETPTNYAPVMGQAQLPHTDVPQTPPSRAVSPMGFYSPTAAAAAAMPQAKGQPQQLLKGLTNKGGLPAAEVAHAPPLPAIPSMTREQLASHFNEAAPDIRETTLQDKRAPLDKDAIQEHLDDAAMRAADRYEDFGYHGYGRDEFEPDEQDEDESDEDYEARTERDRESHEEEVQRQRDEAHEEARDEAYSEGREEAERDLFREAERGHDALNEYRVHDPNAPEPTKYRDYTMPGGHNYREMLLHLPSKWDKMRAASAKINEQYPGQGMNVPDEALKEYDAARNEPEFSSSHWDTPNVLAHLRLTDRNTPEGKKALNMEELQSDWGQEGRKQGFGDRVPNGPYVGNTAQWVDLGLKRAIIEAAKGGYDKLTWPHGIVNANHYNLARRVEALHHYPSNVKPGAFTVGVQPKHSYGISHWLSDLSPQELEAHVGKDLADKIVKGEGHTSKIPNLTHAKTLSNIDLHTGGEGMRAFYDKLIPGQMSKLLKKLDADTMPGQHKIIADERDSDRMDPEDELNEALGYSTRRDNTAKKDLKEKTVHGIDITPRLRAAIMKGLPVFKRGGAVNHEPTEAQKHAGNYKKEHVTFQGLPISIENKKGSTRSGTDAQGHSWSCRMPADYGYIKRTTGADGDHVDVYLGPHTGSRNVFLINQHHEGKFDEHKAMLGYHTEQQALADYKAAFSDGKGEERIGSVHKMSMDAFKSWLENGNTERPLKPSHARQHERETRAAGGRTHFEVAPGKTWSAEHQRRWESLPEAAKDSVSERVLREFLPMWQRSTGITGDVKKGFGGFGGFTNTSYAFHPYDPKHLPRSLHDLGRILRQDAMMGLHEKPFPGSLPMGVARVHLPPGVDIHQAHAIYKHLHGQGLAEGHSTDPETGHMDILAGSGGQDTVDHAKAIDEALGGHFPVSSRAAHVAFPEHGADYGIHRPLFGRPPGAPGQEPEGGDLQARAASRFIDHIHAAASERHPGNGTEDG